MRDAGKEVDWQAPSSRYHLGVDQVDQESVDGDPQLKEIEFKVIQQNISSIFCNWNVFKSYSTVESISIFS